MYTCVGTQPTTPVKQLIAICKTNMAQHKNNSTMYYSLIFQIRVVLMAELGP